MRHMLLSQARSLTRTQVCVFVVPVSAEEPSEGCVREEMRHWSLPGLRESLSLELLVHLPSF